MRIGNKTWFIVLMSMPFSYSLINSSNLTSSLGRSSSAFDQIMFLGSLSGSLLYNKYYYGAFNVKSVLLSTLLTQALQLSNIDRVLSRIPYIGKKMNYVKTIAIGSGLSKIQTGNFNLSQNVYNTLKGAIQAIIIQKIIETKRVQSFITTGKKKLFNSSENEENLPSASEGTLPSSNDPQRLFKWGPPPS